MNEQNAVAVLEPTNEVRRLPLWKACLDDMRLDGLAYGKVYSAEFFEDKLKAPRDTIGFGNSISMIRRELEDEGMYLDGYGQNGGQMILPPGENADIDARNWHAARDKVKRGFKLMNATPLELLSAEEKAKHLKQMEKSSIRLALMRLPLGEARRAVAPKAKELK